jgi:hypothetical protein
VRRAHLARRGAARRGGRAHPEQVAHGAVGAGRPGVLAPPIDQRGGHDAAALACARGRTPERRQRRRSTRRAGGQAGGASRTLSRITGGLGRRRLAAIAGYGRRHGRLLVGGGARCGSIAAAAAALAALAKAQQLRVGLLQVGVEVRVALAQRVQLRPMLHGLRAGGRGRARGALGALWLRAPAAGQRKAAVQELVQAQLLELALAPRATQLPHNVQVAVQRAQRCGALSGPSVWSRQA